MIYLLGPPITQTVEIDGISLLPKQNNTVNAVNRKDIATGPFIMKTPKMSPYNQQLWVIAKIAIDNSDGKELTTNLKYSSLILIL